MSDKRKKQIILIEVAVVFALLIILTAVLMAGGRKEAEPVVDAVEEPEIPMEEENPVNTGKEDGEEQEDERIFKDELDESLQEESPRIG